MTIMVQLAVYEEHSGKKRKKWHKESGNKRIRGTKRERLRHNICALTGDPALEALERICGSSRGISPFLTPTFKAFVPQFEIWVIKIRCGPFKLDHIGENGGLPGVSIRNGREQNVNSCGKTCKGDNNDSGTLPHWCQGACLAPYLIINKITTHSH